MLTDWDSDWMASLPSMAHKDNVSDQWSQGHCEWQVVTKLSPVISHHNGRVASWQLNQWQIFTMASCQWQTQNTQLLIHLDLGTSNAKVSHRSSPYLASLNVRCLNKTVAPKVSASMSSVPTAYTLPALTRAEHWASASHGACQQKGVRWVTDTSTEESELSHTSQQKGVRWVTHLHT